MATDESRQLARISAVADDLDRLLDDLFASVADLKILLLQPEPPHPDEPPAQAEGEAPDA
jgi:hypothetical protein